MPLSQDDIAGIAANQPGRSIVDRLMDVLGSPAADKTGRWANLGYWCTICGVCALPGFALGALADCNIGAMLLGVAAFPILYCALHHAIDSRAFDHSLLRRASRIGFGTKIVMSLIPFAWIPDFIAGGLACEIVGVSPILGKSADFASTLAVTLLSGCFLNLILWVYILLVLGIMRLAGARAAPLPGICTKCGYDLRASPVRCPECGEPVPSAARFTAAV